MFGLGDITFVNNPLAGGAPPTVLSMQNGLSLSGTAGELGGNPLLHDTSFDLANFNFQISNGLFFPLDMQPVAGFTRIASPNANQVTLYLNDLNNQASIYQGNHPGANQALFFDFIGLSYSIGNISGGGTKTQININDGIIGMQAIDLGVLGLQLDFNNFIYKIGDVSLTNNATRMIINDAGATIDLRRFNNQGLFLNFPVFQYWLGDYSNNHNHIRLLIDDGGKQAIIYGSATNQRLMALSINTGDYSIGDLDVIANGNRFIIHDTAQTFNFVNAASGVIYKFDNTGIQTNYWKIAQTSAPIFQINGVTGTYFQIDKSNPANLMRFGDISAIGNATQIQINDTGQYVQIGNAGKIDIFSFNVNTSNLSLYGTSNNGSITLNKIVFNDGGGNYVGQFIPTGSNASIRYVRYITAGVTGALNQADNFLVLAFGSGANSMMFGDNGTNTWLQSSHKLYFATNAGTAGNNTLSPGMVLDGVKIGFNNSASASAIIGNAILAAGTVTINTTSATASCIILLTVKTIGGTPGNLSYTINPGVSFTINSSNVLDTSTISWLIVQYF